MGCDPMAGSTAAPTPTPNKTPVAEKKEAPPAVKERPVTPPSNSVQAKATDNPNRIFQLSSLEKATLKAHGKRLECWVMDTVSKQQEGMMWLVDKDVKDDQGMIFVFADAEPQSFWMQNTLIPLDIIYINEDGKVLNVVLGKPRDETSLPSAGPAKYVLELKGGMAKRFGIGPGTRIDIPSDLKFKPEGN